MSRKAVTDLFSCKLGGLRNRGCSVCLVCEREGAVVGVGWVPAKKLGSSFSTFCLLRCLLMVLGKRTCCGLVGKGVAEKISASDSSVLWSFPTLAAVSFFSEELRSCRGVRFGVLRFEDRFGVFVGEDIFQQAHYLDRGSQQQFVRFETCLAAEVVILSVWMLLVKNDSSWR